MSQENSQFGNSAFVALWVVVAGALGFLFANYNTNPKKFFAANVIPVGFVGGLKGELERRPEGMTRWQRLTSGDEIDDSDKLATGNGAKATIRLAGNRELILGELTQIMLRTVLMSSDRAYDVELLRGTLVASQPKVCNKCAPIIIKTGKESVEVDSGEEVGLFRDVGQFARQFNPKGAWPTLTRPDLGQAVVTREAPSLSDAASADATPPPAAATPIAVARPEPPPNASIRGLEPTLIVPPGLVTLTTLDAPGAIAGRSIAVSLSAPQRAPTESWAPFVEILDASGRQLGPSARISGVARPVAQQVNIPVGTLLRLVPRTGGDLRYLLRSGVVVGAGTSSEKVGFGSRSPLMSISFLGAGPGSTLVGFDSLNAGNSSEPWLAGKTVVDPRSTPLQVHLRYGNDFSRFVPFLKGSSRIGLSNQGFDTSNGTFFVRSGVIVGKISGSLAGSSVGAVARILQASLVFTGAGTSFVELSSSPANTVDTLRRLVNAGQSIYLYNGSDFVPVSSTFILTSPDLATFVGTAKGVFTQRVQIISN